MFKLVILFINAVILYKILKMATKAQLEEVLDQIQSSVENVAADVQKLTDDLANAGIPDDLLARAQTLADRLKTVADITPDVEPNPGGETP